MRTKPLDTIPTTGRGSVSAGEILTLREFGRRLGLANKCLCDAQRQGLRTILFGRCKFVLGSDARKFFAKLAEQQAGDEDQGGGAR
jgi:hypothetical protein